MTDRHRIVLEAVLRALQPLMRLLIRHGVTYPEFAAALKRVFLEAAQAELAERGGKQTDSALTLLSGVHRRDVRILLRAGSEARRPVRDARSLAQLVVGHWLNRRGYRTRSGTPRILPRSGKISFDALVESVSSDVRPRAVLEELKRLGVATESEAGIALTAEGFVPTKGFDAAAAILADNLSDHAAAASRNLDGGDNFLEQAVFADEIGAASVAKIRAVAIRTWRQAMHKVLAEAQARVAEDAETVPEAERNQRVRFGVYFYSEAEEPRS